MKGKNSRQNIFEKWSGALMEKLNEKYLTIVVVVGGTDSCPKIFVIFSFWKEKPFAKKYLTICRVFGRTQL